MEWPAVFSSIVLGNPGWRLAVVAISAAFLLLIAVTTFRAPVSVGWKLLLFTLKAAAVLLLGICLLDPQWNRNHAKPGENLVVLLADSSASMTIRPSADSSSTSADVVHAQLQSADLPWQVRLSQDFNLRRYRFGSTLARSEDYSELAFDESESHLLGALKMLEERFAQQPLAAVLLFTDGGATDRALLENLNWPVPIFPVVDEVDEPAEDLAVGPVVISESNFEDAPLSVQATIQSSGSRRQPVRVTLSPVDDLETAQTLTLTRPPDQDTAPVARFQVRPTGTGPAFYRMRVTWDDELEVFDQPQESREATLANNERLLVFNRDPRPLRILYVGGRPNWEHKFLGRALSSDPLLHLVSLLRIAKKEARFDFRGRAGENSNSLFRGFQDETDEETEAYDEPVLIRLNTRDESELSSGFPQSREELYQYHAIILDDVEADFFTRDQLTLLDRFVAERGGGLMMLGGRDSFRHGRWIRTPVADALPVYLDRNAEPAGGNLRWSLTQEGWLEPWLRLRDTEEQELLRQQQLTPLSILNVTGSIKPGARVLAEVEDDSGNRHPSLVAQQYGRGRTAALLLGDLWKASLGRDESHRDDPEKFWRQVVRWLTGDVPHRLEATVAETVSGPLPATAVQVRVRDRQMQPCSDRRVEIRLRQPDDSVLHLDAAPSLDEAGLYEAVHVSRQAGAYVAEVEAFGDSEEPSLKTSVGWTSDPQAREFERIGVDRTLLDELARRSGGEVVSRARLEDFVSKLGYREMPIMEIETTPLWHRAGLLVAVLALLASEWGLRRMRGLP